MSHREEEGLVRVTDRALGEPGGTTGPRNSENVGQEVLERKGALADELIYRPQAENSQYDRTP